ncbi:acyl-CoA dehydratase activase [Natronobeatus ordinarius]|uniref:acyl-CoA dehydratase activase n=1 Tax=Natronobeatus ordinarius TaxID=2963433 RepID=UPI0020CD087F|nr:acyl-CoA dehydratase activase [Natronobeatus ordinarius]
MSDAATVDGEPRSVAGVDGLWYDHSPHGREPWEWPTSVWVRDDHWSDDGVLTMGIDVGSTSSQVVLMVDRELVAYSTVRTMGTPNESADRALEAIADRADEFDVDGIDFTVGTGYGRVSLDVDETLTEITCHGKGANYLYGGDVRTVLDMGGQDLKTIQIDEKGKVEDFLMNDKCAAGTGRGLESMAELLEVDLTELGPLSLSLEDSPEPVHSTCVVFARDEVTDRLRDGWSVEAVAAAYHEAVIDNIVTLIERVGVEPEFAITGGIAKNPGIVTRLEDTLGVEAITPAFDTQIAGATGAAFFGAGLYEQQGEST